jgi:hypothetical protein
LMRVLEGRAEALAGTFNAQGVVNTLWTYATMARAPGGAGGHVKRAERGKHAVDVCDDGAVARGGGDEGAGGPGGGAGGHVPRAGSGKHSVGVCDDGAGARGAR